MTIPIDYLARIRNYYLALGFPKPYQWATFDTTPFLPLSKPLARCRVGLVTTAAPFQKDKGKQGPGAAYNGGAKFFSTYALETEGTPDVRIAHVGYDRKHTTAEDPATWFPLDALKIAVAEARVGSVSSRFYGLPTSRSQPTTREVDSPALLDLMHEDAVDVALLVANCPVCHQSCSLAARHLEQNGIPTVVMGCAKDIVEHIGVPRLSHADFPLGNAAGRPHDAASQKIVLENALSLFETADEANTTSRVPLDWSDNEQWKEDFYNIDRLSEAEIAKLRADFDKGKAAAKKTG